jgi:hypothetical protein
LNPESKKKQPLYYPKVFIVLWALTGGLRREEHDA